MSRFSNRSKREYDLRKERKVVYIFTEGSKTEPNYFKSIKENIRRKNIKIVIEGNGYNTLSLVNHVIDFKNKLGTDFYEGSDELWAVFDKDSFDKDFDNAIAKAEANGIKVAYSNESFELWYLLHFDYFNTAVNREAYCEKLSDRFTKLTSNKITKYEKNSKEIYSLIKHLEPEAIKHAKKLLESFREEKSPLKKQPSTTVHLLVESLNLLAKEE